MTTPPINLAFELDKLQAAYDQERKFALEFRRRLQAAKIVLRRHGLIDEYESELRTDA